jgi:hypothetical protein
MTTDRSRAVAKTCNDAQDTAGPVTVGPMRELGLAIGSPFFGSIRVGH